jgi:hypothetical protein
VVLFAFFRGLTMIARFFIFFRWSSIEICVFISPSIIPFYYVR